MIFTDLKNIFKIKKIFFYYIKFNHYREHLAKDLCLLSKKVLSACKNKPVYTEVFYDRNLILEIKLKI